MLHGWYSERVARNNKKVYVYEDIYGINTLVTIVTKDDQCPYLEESYSGEDSIYVGKMKTYRYKMKYEQDSNTQQNLIKTYLLTIETDNLIN
tara:strand:- start:1276 stop:1551 length:276 start_codon:yes stop_codon:yes gene_type:complete